MAAAVVSTVSPETHSRYDVARLLSLPLEAVSLFQEVSVYSRSSLNKRTISRVKPGSLVHPSLLSGLLSNGHGTG